MRWNMGNRLLINYSISAHGSRVIHLCLESVARREKNRKVSKFGEKAECEEQAARAVDLGPVYL